jgi:hypothetical protein
MKLSFLVEHLKGVPVRHVEALVTNVRLGWLLLASEYSTSLFLNCTRLVLSKMDSTNYHKY